MLIPGIRNGIPNPRWNRRFLVKLFQRFLNGSRRLAGMRSVLSQARKMTAMTDDMNRQHRAKGVSHPSIMGISKAATGKKARGIS